MREILFRGKRVDNGEWIEGSLVNNIFCRVDTYAAVPYIINPDEYEEYCCMEDIGELVVEVLEETVGQFTGLTDKNGKKIFEGDIVREHVNDYTPIYQNGIYMAYNVDKINDPYVSTQFNVIWRNGCEVIGNIHDNPELLP